VFGGIAGDRMAELVGGRTWPRLTPAGLDEAARRFTAPLGRGRSTDVYALQRELRDTMWDHAGLVREEAGLREALATIDALATRLPAAGVPAHGSLNTAWQDWLNLDNQLQVARLIVLSALERRESRGAHFRRDFPAPSPAAPRSVRVQRADGAPRIWTEPVAFTRAQPPPRRPEPVGVEIGD
jgi:fumarate reductase flavoprotein subunit